MHLAGGLEVGACAGGELGGGGVVGGDHEAGAALGGLGRPGGVDLVEDLLLGPGLDRALGRVGLYRSAVTGAQGQGGRPLPVVDEPVNRLQGCDLLGLGVDEHAEGSAGLDCGELVGVPDREDLGAGRVGLGDDLP